MSRLILASKSAVRAQLLANAGVEFEAVGSSVDEDAEKAALLAAGAGPRAIAGSLAQAKAASVSRTRDGLVIGADQTLDLDGALFDKPASLAEARQHLGRLRGRRHHLHSGVALASEGRVIWSETQSAALSMRSFSDAFLDGYLARNADAVTASVGGYQLEGEGLQLFEQIEGDYFTILGLPMLSLLAALRHEGIIAP